MKNLVKFVAGVSLISTLLIGANSPAFAFGEEDFHSSVNGISVHGYTRVQSFPDTKLRQGTHATVLPTRFNEVVAYGYLYNGDTGATLDSSYVSDGSDGSSDGKVYTWTTTTYQGQVWGKTYHRAASLTDSTSGYSYDWWLD